MSSLAVLPQPIQGVIGSGARRSPTGLPNPQKLVCINGNGSMESGNSSRSSTSGEDGFVSGSSSAEEISYADQLCGPLGALAIGKPSLNSFSGGAFSADAALQKAFASPNNNLLLEQSKLRGVNDHMKEAPLFAAPYQSTFASQPNSFQPCANGPTRPLQLPGAWFYENSLDEGLPGSGSASTGVPGECSPIAELNDEYQYAAFRDALNNPYTVDEHVEVPSSEHVAEIVGRQGCKIKALRAKTNTYIKTPSRNEPPVFRITGRPEDVGEAKHEIECAAEHFTQIRASRRHSQGGMPAPGHVTAYVRVPLRVVGLVVGPKGGTIKRIQQDTHTYIITPSREREPIFEVTGLPENVASARREIEQHIYQRTGNMPITDPNASIQDYDLMAAHAAVIAQVNNGPNRPNYGALAVRRTSGAESGIMELQRNPDLMNAMMRHGLVSKPYSSMSPPLGSVNNIFPLNTYQNSHDMVSNPNSMSSTTAFTRSSNSYQPTSNYQTWTSGFSSLGTQSNGASNFVQDVFSQPHGMHSNGFDSLYNNTLYHANSKFSSRDEGLGDSPTTSCGKLNTESFHLMSSIWSDLEANNTCEQKPSGIPLATA